MRLVEEDIQQQHPPQPFPPPITIKTTDGAILQSNANDISDKQVELRDFLERCKLILTQCSPQIPGHRASRT